MLSICRRIFLWNDRIRLVEKAAEEWKLLEADDRDALRVALERLDDDPIAGVPLFEPLCGYWSYRVGAYRLLYQVAPEARIVLILKVEKVVESGV